jgi:hypothetical protein
MHESQNALEFTVVGQPQRALYKTVAQAHQPILRELSMAINRHPKGLPPVNIRPLGNSLPTEERPGGASDQAITKYLQSCKHFPDRDSVG